MSEDSKEIVIIGAVRTPIGSFKGSLKDIKSLATTTTRTMLAMAMAMATTATTMMSIMTYTMMRLRKIVTVRFFLRI